MGNLMDNYRSEWWINMIYNYLLFVNLD
jgi:hypothetical protein